MTIDQGTPPESTDAVVWTREWLKTIAKHPTIPFDEGAMLGWFTNAIVAGFDEARRRYEPKAQTVPNQIIEQIRQRESEHQMLHERDASIPPCLPAGCSPDQGDIPVLIAIVDSLTEKLRAERELSKATVNAQGHVNCPACASPLDKNGHLIPNVAAKRARPNAGRPRNCPNFKACRGRLKSAADKTAELCRKCRKAVGNG